MSRFRFDGKYSMRVMNKKSLLAFFNVVDTKLGIEMSDMRLLEGKNGVFVKSPSREYQKDGDTKYADYIRPAFEDDARNEDGVAYFEEMATAAYEHYEALGGADGDEEEEERPRGRKAKPAARSAREEEPEGGDEEEEEERPARAAKPTRTGRGPVPTTGKSGKSGKSIGGRKLPF